jgi:hypothetical protein
METIVYDIFVVWMMSAVALGVGASSLAITSFLVALVDGTIDKSERRMLEVIYWVLRSSMLMIVGTVFVVTWLEPEVLQGTPYIWTLVAVLYINAILMTVHKMPRSIGPALQAATWYTLGFLLTIELFDLAPLTPLLFGLLYAGDIIFFSVLVNGFLRWMRKRKLQ